MDQSLKRQETGRQLATGMWEGGGPYNKKGIHVLTTQMIIPVYSKNSCTCRWDIGNNHFFAIKHFLYCFLPWLFCEHCVHRWWCHFHQIFTCTFYLLWICIQNGLINVFNIICRMHKTGCVHRMFYKLRLYKNSIMHLL